MYLFEYVIVINLIIKTIINKKNINFIAILLAIIFIFYFQYSKYII